MNVVGKSSDQSNFPHKLLLADTQVWKLRKALTNGSSTNTILIPLGLTAAASATDATTHKKMFGRGTTTLIISNEEVNDIIKIIKSLEESGLLIKRLVSETIKKEEKQQKIRFLSILLGTLGASLWGNLLTGKGSIATSQGQEANMPGRGTIRAGEGTIIAGKGIIRAGQDF